MQVECCTRISANGDVPYWIKRSDFEKHFDQVDARLLFPVVLVQAYLTEWFSLNECGELTYTIPGVHFVKGKTEFFNGRHRTALLLGHLDEVLISFNTKSGKDERLLEMIPKRPAKSSDRLSVPDLPIWKDKDSMLAGSEAPVLLSLWAADPEIRKKMNPPPEVENLAMTRYAVDSDLWVRS